MGHLRNQNHRKNKGFPKRRREGGSGGNTGSIVGAVSGVIGASAGIYAGLWAMGKAKDQDDVISTYESQITQLENERPAIINPYEDNVRDLSAMLVNPMENLGVATKAAEFQAEQADISLSNTLDTLRATGAGAGGATALATAALKSKQQVSASLEAQERENNKLRAQGEQQLQQQKLAEAQRIQQAGLAGDMFVFEQEDKRKMQQLDRAQAQMDQARQYQVDMQTQGLTAFGTTVGMLGDIAGAAIAQG